MIATLRILILGVLTGSAAAEITCGTLGPCLQTLDRQIDLTAIDTDDHDLNILAFGQVLANVTDIKIGHFGNMYHAGMVFRKGNECAKICD